MEKSTLLPLAGDARDAQRSGGFIHGLFEIMSCVTLGKGLDLSVPQLAQHQIMMLLVATSLECGEDYMN